MTKANPVNEHKRICVGDVMRREFNMANGLDTVSDALKAMQHKDSHAFIIEKRDANDEYGLVLLSDIAKKVIAADKAPERVNLYEIMAKPAICVHENMDIRYCARLFDNFGMSLAPVVDEATGKELVGTVTYEDIVLCELPNGN